MKTQPLLTGPASRDASARRMEALHLCWRASLTFELTPRAEAGGVSPVRDDATPAADRAYDACRSESGVERVGRPHRVRAAVAHTCKALHSVEGGRFVETLAEHELDAARALRTRKGGERGLAVLRKAAAPNLRPAERQGAVPRLQRARSGPCATEARVRERYCTPGARTSRSMLPARATHRLLCFQRWRQVRSGQPRPRARPQCSGLNGDPRRANRSDWL